MQGNVSIATMERFLPAFFTALREDGQVDRAMAVARGEVRDEPDSWMPVLITRLRTGRVWHTGRFADASGFQRWPAVLDRIKRGACTPILGPGMYESLLGSRPEIAQRWARDYSFPLAPSERDDLPRVAQYVAVAMQDAEFPASALRTSLRDWMLERYREDLPPELRDADDPLLLDLIAAVGAQQRERDQADPHKVLAELPFEIYITTSPTNLLDDALRDAGKEPRLEICRWNSNLELLPSAFDDPAYEPSVEQPLVFHAFGYADDLQSLVLTEDDFFDYLIGVTDHHDLIPSRVRESLTNNALLFLGFQVEDWIFRVLFRTILSQKGSMGRRRFSHVAVQVDPDDDRIVDQERARHYLEGYFRDEDVSVYWGSAEDFVREVQEGLAKQRPNPAPGGR
jgi:hypothetical protein